MLGEANPDLVLSGEVEPVFGQAERLVHHDLVLGGSGALTACAAARLGLRTALIGVVGDDALGRFVLDTLATRGVDSSGCRVETTLPTGITVILLRGDDRAILTSAGTIAALRGADVSNDLLVGAGHVHVSSYFLQDALRSDLPGLFEGVRARGGTTSVDPNWDPAGVWDGGLHELLPLVAVKDGAAGGLGVEDARLVRVAAPEAGVAPPVDTVGAGDAFDAGFLAGWLDGMPFERGLALAVSCGTLSTHGRGGTGAQPTMEQALAEVGSP